MPFEDFYKKEDEWKRRWRYSALCVALLLIVYLAVGFWYAGNDPADEPTPNAETVRARRLERVKNLCQNLPKPELFDLQSATLPEHNAQQTIVAEYFKSNRNFDEVMPFFQLWLLSNGWSLDESGQYDKDVLPDRYAIYNKSSQTISIYYFDFNRNSEMKYSIGNYLIRCQERASEISGSITDKSLIE